MRCVIRVIWQTSAPKSENIVWSDSLLKSEDRTKLTGCKGATIWLTGLSGSGKSTIGDVESNLYTLHRIGSLLTCGDDSWSPMTAGAIVEKVLIERGHLSYRMDGDNLRHGLNRVLHLMTRGTDLIS